MARQKLNCIYNGDKCEIATLARIAGVSHDTIRGRLTRTAELKEIDGTWFFVCEERHLTPAIPVGRKPATPKAERQGFTVTRYSVSTDGGKDTMHLAERSQKWLCKPIRTKELNYD